MIDPFQANLFGSGIESVRFQNVEVDPFDMCIVVGRPLLEDGR